MGKGLERSRQVTLRGLHELPCERGASGGSVCSLWSEQDRAPRGSEGQQGSGRALPRGGGLLTLCLPFQSRSRPSGPLGCREGLGNTGHLPRGPGVCDVGTGRPTHAPSGWHCLPGLTCPLCFPGRREGGQRSLAQQGVQWLRPLARLRCRRQTHKSKGRLCPRAVCLMSGEGAGARGGLAGCGD